MTQPSSLVSRRRCALAIAAPAFVAGLLFTSLSASGPSFWTMATNAEFLRGTSEGVFVSSSGALSLAPALANRLTATPPQVWSVAEAPDGTIWAGTGGDGRLLRVRPGQAEETAFDSAESHIFAVAQAGARVYAASSPDGRVYVIDGSAAARPFFDPEEKYIWALAVDAGGRVWVGAGNPAVIYRVNADGTGTALYRPPAGHVVTLVRDNEGRMLAGTESPGRLYRFGPDDRPFALLDSGLPELRAVAVSTDGVIYAAAISKADDAGASESAVPSVAAISAPAPTSGATPAAAPPARRSVLFRIDTSGTWEPLWESTDVIYDLAAADNGAVIAATGQEGRLYRIERDREVLLLTGVDARQITRFAGRAKPGAQVPVLATANPGRIMAPASGAPATPATYTSPVRDTKNIATWGLIRWEAGPGITLSTRSGNTERPDDSWSAWSNAYTRRDGEAITSPAARFIQWRATFARSSSATQAAQLTAVTVAYLPRNARPVLTTLTVHPPGVVFGRPFSSDDGAIAGLDDARAEARRPPGDPPPPAAPGRRMFQKGLQTLVWKGEDPDADRLLYAVQYRRQGETAWRDLRTGLLDTIFVWDTTTVPDGRYLVRVVASDSPGNSDDRALTAERESEPIDVDNTPPQITTEVTRQGNVTRAVVRVRDTQSPIAKLEFALAGAAWQLVYPADGLADSLEERFEFTLPAGTDPATVVVRATDLLQNTSSAAVGR
jgi:hypothetical protein